MSMAKYKILFEIKYFDIIIIAFITRIFNVHIDHFVIRLVRNNCKWTE